MSSNLNTPMESPKEATPVESVPEQRTNEENTNNIPTTTTTTKTIENALPWDHIDHQIPIKSFSGYTVKLNGWVRHDIREERKREEIEKLEKEKLEKKQQEEIESSKTISPLPNTTTVPVVTASSTTSAQTN